MATISPYIPQYGGAAAPYSSLLNYGNQPAFGMPDLGDPNAALSGFQMPGAGGITDVLSGGGRGITSVMAPSIGESAGGRGIFGGLKGILSDSGFLGSTGADGIKTEGWGGAALGLGQGIANAYMGMKQYGLAKDQLAEGKRQFEKNYAAQQSTTNTALEDRQRARVASNPGAYQSVGAYMAQNGIK